MTEDALTGANIVPFKRGEAARDSVERDTQTLVSYFTSISSPRRRRLLVQIAHRFLTLETIEAGKSDEAIAMAHAVANDKLLEILQEVMDGESER